MSDRASRLILYEKRALPPGSSCMRQDCPLLGCSAKGRIEGNSMSLAVGTNLGPYQILSLIATGGMGEVYRARDTRLHRIVAVKVSRSEFGERFALEARADAALNHPHICALYDVGPDYLVMEFVQGETLGVSLKNGRLFTDIALRYAAQIAQAVAAAHSQDIIHRDLK